MREKEVYLFGSSLYNKEEHNDVDLILVTDEPERLVEKLKKYSAEEFVSYLPPCTFLYYRK